MHKALLNDFHMHAKYTEALLLHLESKLWTRMSMSLWIPVLLSTTEVEKTHTHMGVRTHAHTQFVH